MPVEFGKRVAIVEDQYRFILHHQVMDSITDERVAIDRIAGTRQRFAAVHSISMDKGFHSKANQQHLAEVVAMPVRPKQGQCNQAEAAPEHDPECMRLRHRHAAVESAIKALQAQGR